jgi:hypothetical protein
VPGKPLKLTVDIDLQVAAEEALEGKNGAIVAMDPRTYAAMSARARQYAREWILSIPFQVEHRRLFEEAVQRCPDTGNAKKDALPAL